jgi:hypothetical protein
MNENIEEEMHMENYNASLDGVEESDSDRAARIDAYNVHIKNCAYDEVLIDVITLRNSAALLEYQGSDEEKVLLYLNNALINPKMQTFMVTDMQDVIMEWSLNLKSTEQAYADILSIINDYTGC